MGELTVKVRTEQQLRRKLKSSDIPKSQSPQELARSVGVIDKGNTMVFDGSGSLKLPGQCARVASVKKLSQGCKNASRCMRKMVCLSCGLWKLKNLRRRVSVGGGPIERAETQAG